MSYEDLMARIAREIPELDGKLSAPRVTYVKSLQKTYITFDSSVLAGEKQFLKLESLLQKLFPGRPLSVRIVSRGLRRDFLADPTPYRQVLVDFLRRNYPSATGWIGQIGWQIEENQLRSEEEAAPGEKEALLTLVLPDEFCLRVMSEKNIGPRLAVAIREIFDARVRVELTVAGDREERLRKMQEERREMVWTVTREEMEKRAAAQAGNEGGAGEPAAALAEKKPRVRKPAEKTEKPEKAGKKPEAEPAFDPDAAAVGRPILGRSIADRPVEIKELTGESGLVVIQGEIFKLEKKELKGGEMLLVSFAVTDYTSSILCKYFFRYRPRFARKEDAENKQLCPGAFRFRAGHGGNRERGAGGHRGGKAGGAAYAHQHVHHGRADPRGGSDCPRRKMGTSGGRRHGSRRAAVLPGGIPGSEGKDQADPGL